MKNLILKAITALKYPSTWKGAITLLAVFGITLNPEQAQAIMTAGAAVVGAIALFFSDSDVK